MRGRKAALAIILVAAMAIAGCASEDSEKSSDSGTKDTKKEAEAKLYPERKDAQKEDKEAKLGGSVELSGYTATLKTAAFQKELSVIETDGYLVAEVEVLNRDDSSQPYSVADWKIQTPNGQVQDATFTAMEGALQSGDLVNKGKAAGKVAFTVNDVKGDFYVIYKPDPFDAARGIWKVTL